MSEVLAFLAGVVTAAIACGVGFYAFVVKSARGRRVL